MVTVGEETVRGMYGECEDKVVSHPKPGHPGKVGGGGEGGGVGHKRSNCNHVATPTPCPSTHTNVPVLSLQEDVSTKIM